VGEHQPFIVQQFDRCVVRKTTLAVSAFGLTGDSVSNKTSQPPFAK
jgi:hypothetical protein